MVRGESGERQPCAVRSSKTLLVASMFERLAGIERLVRVILDDARLTVALTFRGEPEKRVFLDFRGVPGRVEVDRGDVEAATADAIVAIDGESMHEVLLGRRSPGEAFARRELLLRGSAAHLARLVPLFDVAPVLYREHLADRGVPGYARRSARRRRAGRKEKSGMGGGSNGRGALVPDSRSGVRRGVAWGLERVAYVAGVGIGLLRYRVFQELSLFELLAALSRGVAAATPPVVDDGEGGRRG